MTTASGQGNTRANKNTINVPGYKGLERRSAYKGAAMEIPAKQLEGMVEKVVTDLVAQRMPDVIHEGVHKALIEAQRVHAPSPTHVAQAQADALQRARTQNGVREPGTEGKCRDAWNALSALSQREPVTVASARAVAQANGWNERNTVIEFYRWKRFHGYQAPAQQLAQAAIGPTSVPTPAPRPAAAPAPRKQPVRVAAKQAKASTTH